MEASIKFNQSVDIPTKTIEKILKDYMIINYGTSWENAALTFKIDRVYVGHDDVELQLIGAKINQRN